MRRIKVLVIVALGVLFFACGNKDTLSLDLIPVRNGDVYQYIDNTGKVVINPQFAEATAFREGLALVQDTSENPKWGFIGRDGKYVIAAKYKYATVFSEGLAWVVAENEAPMAINKKGEKVFSLPEAETVYLFRDGLAAFNVINASGETSWGFVDKKGEIKINPQFSFIWKGYSEGLCAAANDDFKWGYIDKEGKVVINYQFNSASYFKNGRATVLLGDKIGTIGKDGKYVINPQFEDMDYDGDWYMIKQSNRIGWCDKDGKITINPQFDEAFPFNGNKLAPVRVGKTWGYIDREGKIVIPSQFDMATPFVGNMAVVAVSEKVGLIDKDGKYIVNPEIEELSEDILLYILNGNTPYMGVNTDYFNVNLVAAGLSFDTPGGFTVKSTYGDIAAKLELKESNFNKYNNEHIIIKSKPLSGDAEYSLYTIGSPFKETKVVNQGWFSSYTTTKYQFDSQAKPLAYGYKIRLKKNGEGKEDMVVKAIESKLKELGYNKAAGENRGLQYLGKTQDVGIYQDKNEVIVEIIFHLS